MKFLSRFGAPVKALFVAGLLAVVMGAGWFGAASFASEDDDDASSEKFIPHARACVDNYGRIRVLLKDHQDCDQHWKYPFLIASEEKVDAISAYTRSYSSATDSVNFKDVSVQCDSDDRATGGGARLSLGTPDNNTNAGDNVALQSSYPVDSGGSAVSGGEATGWRATARELQNVPGDANATNGSGVNDTGYWNTQKVWGWDGAFESTNSNWTLFVYVICTEVLYED